MRSAPAAPTDAAERAVDATAEAAGEAAASVGKAGGSGCAAEDGRSSGVAPPETRSVDAWGGARHGQMQTCVHLRLGPSSAYLGARAAILQACAHAKHAASKMYAWIWA